MLHVGSDHSSEVGVVDFAVLEDDPLALASGFLFFVVVDFIDEPVEYGKNW